jgi:sulfur relay (sulfurtransferase) complex TusBCD TusD component (DsrE family)
VANFGFILGKSPCRGENIETLYHLTSAALRKNHKVFIFLQHDAIFSPIKTQRALEDRENPRDLLEDLLMKGCQVICFDRDIRLRGIDSSRTYVDGIKTGGLPDLSEAVAGLDRLISL